MKLVSTVIAASLLFSLSASAQKVPRATEMPLSAKSAQVHRLLDQAWILDSDQVEQAKAIDVMKQVVKVEPEFAIGHEILARITLNPAEQISEQK